MTRRTPVILAVALLGLSALSFVPAASANECDGLVDTNCDGTCGSGCGYGCGEYFNTGIGLVRSIINIAYGHTQYCWG